VRKTSDLRKAEIVATILGLADRIGPDRVTTVAVAAEVGVTQAAPCVREVVRRSTFPLFLRWAG